MKQGVKKMLDEHMMPNMPMRGGSMKKGGKKGGKSGKRGC